MGVGFVVKKGERDILGIYTQEKRLGKPVNMIEKHTFIVSVIIVRLNTAWENAQGLDKESTAMTSV